MAAIRKPDFQSRILAELQSGYLILAVLQSGCPIFRVIKSSYEVAQISNKGLPNFNEEGLVPPPPPTPPTTPFSPV